MDASVFREAVFRVHEQGRARGHYFLQAEDERFVDRTITVGGRGLLSFGSCSYLGLEFDDRLVEGAVDAVLRYRSQTSYSRGYLSCPLYRELEEDLLARLFGVREVLLLPSTSAAHHVAIPALLDERDVAIVDHQVHRSVDDAVTLQCARSGARKEVVKHGELDRVYELAARLSRLHRRVWVFCDGVYSMYGDHLPVEFLDAVHDLAPNVGLYVDDAHGMSWDGSFGRGHLLARRPLDDRTVVVTSLAKGFGTGGGVIVSHDRSFVELARLVGGPYSFSGPLRPADLGATRASALVHLSPDLVPLQRALAARVQQANALCRELGLPLLLENPSPIFFVALGRAEAVFTMAERLRDDGWHVNVSGFPAVPASRGGLRIAINAVHTEAQVDGLFRAIARHLPAVLSEVGVAREELDRLFDEALPPFLRSGRVRPVLDIAPAGTADSTGLEVARAESIDELDPIAWDRLHGGLAYVDSASMRAVEAVFNPRTQTLPEYRWTYRYLRVLRGSEVVAAAPFTTSLLKDDLFMSEDVSRALEEVRQTEPYAFTSKTFATGAMTSEGLHVWLTDGPDRDAALVRLIEAARATAAEQGCRTVVFGDFPDPGPLSERFTAQGFVPMRLYDNHVVPLDWRGEDDFVARLPTKSKRAFLRVLRADEDRLRCEVWDGATPVDDRTIEWLHELYLRLARKNLKINLFPLPAAILKGHLASGSWRFLVLYDGDRERPVAYAGGRLVGEDARWLYCGVDYEGYDLERFSPYRHLVWRLIRWSGQHGARRVHLGMGADREKARFGSVRVPTYAFVRSDDDYQSAKLQELVERLAIARRAKGER